MSELTASAPECDMHLEGIKQSKTMVEIDMLHVTLQTALDHNLRTLNMAHKVLPKLAVT